MELVKYSLVVPVYPKDFGCLQDVVKHINAFYVDESKYAVDAVYIAASECGAAKAEELKQMCGECNYEIIVVPTESQGYPGANRNRGWEEALKRNPDGWMVFLDSDDHHHQDKLHAVYEAIQLHPDATLFLHSFVFGKDKPAEWDARDMKTVRCENMKEPVVGGYWLYTGKNVHHGMATVRASETLRYNASKKDAEDTEFDITLRNRGDGVVWWIDHELVAYYN